MTSVLFAPSGDEQTKNLMPGTTGAKIKQEKVSYQNIGATRDAAVRENGRVSNGPKKKRKKWGRLLARWVSNTQFWTEYGAVRLRLRYATFFDFDVPPVLQRYLFFFFGKRFTHHSSDGL